MAYRKRNKRGYGKRRRTKKRRGRYTKVRTSRGGIRM